MLEKTEGPLTKIMNGCRDDWRHYIYKRSPIAEHFHSENNDFLNHASVSCLEHNVEWPKPIRMANKGYKIQRMNTLASFAINKGRSDSV